MIKHNWESVINAKENIGNRIELIWIADLVWSAINLETQNIPITTLKLTRHHEHTFTDTHICIKQFSIDNPPTCKSLGNGRKLKNAEETYRHNENV